MTTVNLSQAKDQLSKLVKETAETTRPVAISVNGRKEVMLISLEEYESLKETIEILKDRDLVRKIYRSLQEIQKGELIPFETFKQEL